MQRQLQRTGAAAAGNLSWADLVDQQPALAAVAQQKLLKPGVLLVGTTRRDGSARISGVEPLVMDGELWLSMMTTSTKALDLRHDPRISINSIVAGPEPAVEVKVRGTARVVHDLEVQERYAAKVSAELGWQPVVGQFTLFAIDIFDVAQVGYDPETHGQHVARVARGGRVLETGDKPNEPWAPTDGAAVAEVGAATPPRRLPRQPSPPGLHALRVTRNQGARRGITEV